MKISRKVDFNSLKWEFPFEGIRHKYLDQDQWRLRLVEYSQEMPLHWCQKGHYGYVLSGRMEIEFEYGKEKIIYNPGDGIFIPDGPEHKHQGKPLTEKVLIFFLEKL